MVPYHLMTGDVSQANYSSLRAAMNGSYSMVDDWQQNEVLPMLCLPAVQRLSFTTLSVLHTRSGATTRAFSPSNGPSRCRFAEWSTRSKT